LINSDISDKNWNTEVETSKKVLTYSLCKFNLINDLQLNNTFESLSWVLKSGSKLVSIDSIINTKTTRVRAWFVRNDKKPYIREINQHKKAFSKIYFKLNVAININSFQKLYNFISMIACKKS
jgi:hypothetical protein